MPPSKFSKKVVHYTGIANHAFYNEFAGVLFGSGHFVGYIRNLVISVLAISGFECIESLIQYCVPHELIGKTTWRIPFIGFLLNAMQRVPNEQT